MECHVFKKLWFQVIISNQFLHERQVIIVYEDLCTYLLDNRGKKNQILCSIGELHETVKREYVLSVMEDMVVYPLAVMDIQVNSWIPQVLNSLEVKLS